MDYRSLTDPIIFLFAILEALELFTNQIPKRTNKIPIIVTGLKTWPKRDNRIRMYSSSCPSF